jgi:hypothetical protein
MDNCRVQYRNVMDDMYKNTTEIHVQKIKHQKLVGTPTTDEPIKMTYSGKRFLINGIDPLKPVFVNDYKPEEQKPLEQIINDHERGEVFKNVPNEFDGHIIEVDAPF